VRKIRLAPHFLKRNSPEYLRVSHIRGYVKLAILRERCPLTVQ